MVDGSEGYVLTVHLTSRLQRSIVLILGIVLLGSVCVSADQAQYFYDELGHLVGVVESSGDAAVYNYDPVGNLLSIQRFTAAPTGVGIFLLAPGSALVGANVEIRGFGFTDPLSSNQVQVNGTTATVISATATSIIATVPAGATSGLVTVINANGTATSPQPLTVLVPPIITGVDPPKVPQGVVTRVLIEGFNLKTASAVTFTQAGLTATILAGATDDTVPISLSVSGGVPIGTYAFAVTTPSGTAQSGTVHLSVTTPFPTFGTGKIGVLKPADGTVSGPSFGFGKASVSMP
jgi:YD repeat-containing protein